MTDTSMSSRELVEIVRLLDLDPSATDALEACEAFWVNGCADEQDGDVEGPEGFFYRVSRWVVDVDNFGFRNITEHGNEQEARDDFEYRAKVHSEESNPLWDDD